MTAPVEPTSPSELFTPFLPTTYNIPIEGDTMMTFLNQHFANSADVINDKKIGTYVQAAENFNGNTFYYDSTKVTRNGYQVLARIPSWIPQTLTLTTIPQYPIRNVNPQFIISHVWGSASLPCSAVGAGDGDYFSFYGSGNAKIQFTMSDVAIIITTNGTTAGYQGFIFIEYIRAGV